MAETSLSTVNGGRRARLPLALAGAVAAVSVGGAAISVAASLNPDLVDALGPRGWLSVPLPMLLVQLGLAALAGLRRRAVAATAAALLGTACTVAVISGFFDGGYTDARVSSGLRGYQMLLVTSLIALGTVAFVRLRQVLRGPTQS